MKKTLINLPTFACASLLLAAVLLSSCGEPKTYQVEITYCDSRPKDTINYRCGVPPNNSDIYTYKVAVPEWNGKLNVCNIRVLNSR